MRCSILSSVLLCAVGAWAPGEAQGAILVPTGVGAYPSTILADSPTAWFRLNEAPASPTAMDQVGGRIGAVSGGVSFGSTGPLAFGPSKAASFVQSSSGKIDVSFDATLNTSSFSIELWTKTTGGSSYRGPITSRSSTPGTSGYLMYVNPSNQLEYWVGSSTWAVETGPTVTSGWMHLVGTYDSGTSRMKYFVNGTQIDSQIVTPFIVNPDRPFRIGGGATESTGAFFFEGDISEVAYYNYALSNAQVLAHFDAASQQLFLAVPEPSTNVLLGLGGLGLSLCVRRRRRTAAARS